MPGTTQFVRCKTTNLRKNKKHQKTKLITNSSKTYGSYGHHGDFLFLDVTSSWLQVARVGGVGLAMVGETQLGVFEAMITRGSCWHQFSCKWNGDHCDMLWVFVRHWRQLWENCFWMSFAGYPAVTSFVNWFIAGFPVYEPHHHTFSFLNSRIMFISL